ncbi:MAG: zinc-dependent alcohol dehydrogenase [Limnochordia bacterium]|jgi:(R,R)-butanediol dehydrogenase/meso-butanediol dehydrogenase/diacetyl reductase
MRSLVWLGPNEMEVQDRPIPKTGPGQVLIKVDYTGICGSDVTIFQGKHPRSKPPLIIGHEFVGEVSALGQGVSSRLKIGDVVTAEPTFNCGVCSYCRSNRGNLCSGVGVRGVDGPGAFAEYFVTDEDKVYKLPENLPRREGALIEPLAVGVHAVARSGLAHGEDVAIIGAGPIGLLTAQAARALGAGRIFLLEVKPNRIEIARQMGFTAFDAREGIEAVLEATDGAGVDVLFDAAGVGPGAAQFVPLTKKGARITIVAIFKDPPPVDLRSMAYRELSLHGCFIYVPEDFHRAVELVTAGKIDFNGVISHEFPLEEAHAAFDTMVNGPDSMKVLIKI